MSTILFLIKAYCIGFAVAAPVGPIGVLCIRKTLQLGLTGGLAVGLGAALADSFFGFLAGAGLSVISGFLLDKAAYIELLGGFFLCYLAIQEWRAKANMGHTIASDRKKFLKLISQTFFLTLSNPLTILSFMGIFASLGGFESPWHEWVWLLLGIFLGSMSWWLILARVATHAQGKLSQKWLDRVRYLSAAILMVFACFALGNGVWDLCRLSLFS